jgi:hypothetical protein
VGTGSFKLRILPNDPFLINDSGAKNCFPGVFPDITTKNGLKKVHFDFEKVWKRLDETYTSYENDYHITGTCQSSLLFLL